MSVRKPSKGFAGIPAPSIGTGGSMSARWRYCKLIGNTGGSVNGYIILITIFGEVMLLTAWLPTLLKSVPFSLPIACTSLGAILALLPFS
jgi:hypothetical protein